LPETLTFSYTLSEALCWVSATAGRKEEEEATRAEKCERKLSRVFHEIGVLSKNPAGTLRRKTGVFCAGEVQIRWSLDWTRREGGSYKNMHRKIRQIRIASNNNLNVRGAWLHQQKGWKNG